MSKVKKVRFFAHEVQELLNEFAYEPAPLEKDLNSIELEALASIGRLKYKGYTYLGIKFPQIMSFLHFFLRYSSPLFSEKDEERYKKRKLCLVFNLKFFLTRV